VLIRHAQAADAPGDRERPLTPRGARNATAIGRWLESAGLVPDRVLVSPALRARQTWDRAAESLVPDLPPTVEERLYENTVESVLATITETAEDVQTLILVGHNPSVGQLSFDLDDGEGDQDAQRQLHAGFPAGAVALFEVGAPLGDLRPGAATLTRFEVPTA
jgi:phosphohistidine phosphatase